MPHIESSDGEKAEAASAAVDVDVEDVTDDIDAVARLNRDRTRSRGYVVHTDVIPAYEMN
jgi:hypothetical protein